MKRIFFQLLFLTSFLLLTSSGVSAQIDASTPDGIPRREELPKSIKETLMKYEIERTKKDHEEMIEHGVEASNLSREIHESYLQTGVFAAGEQEKLDRLEKLVKKIRKELGADSDDEDEKYSLDLESALNELRDGSALLLEELSKTTRYSISAAAIERSNSLLGLIKKIRNLKN